VLYHLSFWLKQHLSWANALHYVSMRGICALLTALAQSLFFGGWFIRRSRRFFRSQARVHAPQHHQESKNDMPTMGGIFILLTVVSSTLLWADLTCPKVWIFLGVLGGFGAIGAADDWQKIVTGHGIAARTKFALQLLVSGLSAVLWIGVAGGSTQLVLPLFKQFNPDLGGVLFTLWAIFVIVGTSNAVNLTDGLDGLAIGSLIPNFALFSLIAYAAGHIGIASYLHIPFAETAEVAVMGAALVGAALGFLWFNTYPAEIFMGDVGSLALGAGLATMALMAKQELLLPIAGGLFVVETVSVIIQVLSMRIRGKRVFRMAPLHHHFELLGWPESRITIRFGIISFVLCLLTLMMLKVR